MANQYINNLVDTWTSGVTTYAGIKLNVTNTASAAGSKILELEIGGVDMFTVSKAGAAVAASSITAGAAVLIATNDGGALGVSGTAWSDLFLASGGVINWDAADVTITHSANTLTFAGASSGYIFDATVTAHSGTAIPAGGTAGAGFRLSSTSNFGVFFGSGAPTLNAAQGSLYLRSDGSSTSTRAYINTNGTNGWTAITTAA